MPNNEFARASGDSSTNTFPDTATYTTSDTTSHRSATAAPSRFAKAADARRASWACRPIQLRRRPVLLLGWSQAAMVL